jgi:hypothetical protein
VADLELLQDDRLVPGAPERVRRRGAHDAGADDDDLGALGHGGPMLLVHRHRSSRQVEQALDVAHALDTARFLDEVVQHVRIGHLARSWTTSFSVCTALPDGLRVETGGLTGSGRPCYNAVAAARPPMPGIGGGGPQRIQPKI